MEKNMENYVNGSWYSVLDNNGESTGIDNVLSV